MACILLLVSCSFAVDGHCCQLLYGEAMGEGGLGPTSHFINHVRDQGEVYPRTGSSVVFVACGRTQRRIRAKHKSLETVFIVLSLCFQVHYWSMIDQYIMNKHISFDVSSRMFTLISLHFPGRSIFSSANS